MNRIGNIILIIMLIGGLCLGAFLVYGEIKTDNFCIDKGHDKGVFKQHAYVCIDYTEYPR